MRYSFEPGDGSISVYDPPAIVVQAFDEQQAKREWDEAVADGQDAVERRAAILQKAFKQWPMVTASHPGRRASGLKDHSPELRRFVRDVLGLADQASGGMNSRAVALLKHGAEGQRALWKAERKPGHERSARKIRAAAVELVEKYRLGADGNDCMNALAKFIEETQRG